MIHTHFYSVCELTAYIDWSYFFHAWGFPSHVERMKKSHQATEAIKLRQDAIELLDKWEKESYRTCFRIALHKAFGDEDDIVLPDLNMRIPLLRQQHSLSGEPSLCLSDFVRPLSLGIPDCIGIFASTVDAQMEQEYKEDDYLHLLAQTLADRLAEATAEIGHLQTRREWWGYAPEENLSSEELFKEHYQGIRPAVGYPSLPDQSLIFELDKILDFKSMGISLTENGAMSPHGSTCGLMLAHAQARHFSVGKVGEDQLRDYAQRRNADISWLRKFL